MSSRNNSVSIAQLLSVIPEEDIRKIAKKTKVDYYTKILDGKSLLYLILYSLIETQRNSLRTMEDIFNSASFKFLFNLDSKKKVKYNSISERLSVINIDFFKRAYDTIYDQFSKYYAQDEIEKLNLIRVDSTLVAEAANKLKRGMNIGKKKDGKKQVKYTIAYDGKYPCMSELFTEKEHLSEDITIPSVVYKYADKNKDCVFVFDRGVSKRKVYCDLNQKPTFFVTRLKDKFRYRVVCQLNVNNKKIGTLEVVNDQIIQLGVPNSNKFLDDHFRLVTAINPQNKINYFFLTNLIDSKVEEVLSYYKKRWDIEVFIRFLKQELNFSHLTSTSENGMMIMMYMTMIASILVLTYKRINNIGYKTAVRRISFELNELIIKMIVTQCGGDPSLVFR
ncbi:MAG: IS4 family transposase [Bacteroidota bacterium]